MNFKLENFLYLLMVPGSVLVGQNKNINLKKPNIIFIYSDDQRMDAAGFNHNPVILTPELDKMAKQGVNFTQANVVFSLCSPSRAALLTGRYGSVNGVLEHGSDLNPNEKTIAQYLREEGYLTGMSGKWHIGRNPSEAGFDFSVWFEGNGMYYGRTIHDQGKTVQPQSHCDQYCVARSVDFLKEAVKSQKPFFLFHNTQLPHMDGKHAWDAGIGTKERYDVANMPVPGNRLDILDDKPEYLKTVRNRTQAKVYDYPDPKAIQNHTRDYYSVITEMDEFLGEIFHTLDDLGIRENTYIFFMSDNGWILGEHGFTSKVLPYSPSTRVPLFVAGPGIHSRSDDHLVLNIDMAPTILELAGIHIPGTIHGKSIVPLLHNKNKSWREAFVYEGLGSYGGAKPNLTVISKRFRYIITYDDASLSGINFRELYDQENDPDEMVNLVNDENYSAIIKEMDQLIGKHRRDVLK